MILKNNLSEVSSLLSIEKDVSKEEKLENEYMLLLKEIRTLES